MGKAQGAGGGLTVQCLALEDRKIQPSEEDFRVAAEVIARWPDAPKVGTPEYAQKLGALAQFRAEFDHDSFDLRFGRREPVCGAERLRVRADREDWDQTRFAKEIQAFAERPVDAEMIEDAHADLKRRIDAYADLLVRVIDAATDQRDPGRAEREEDEIAAMWDDVLVPSGMFTTEIVTLDAFLIKIRAENRPAVTCGGMTERTGRLLVWRVLGDSHRLWKSHREIAEKSRRSSEYSRRVSTVELFYGSVAADNQWPKPLDMIALIDHERDAAKSALAKDDIESGHWCTAGQLPPKLYSKVRQAAQPNRKRLKVRSMTHLGTKMYYLPDIRLYWRTELPESLR